jgi:hypothetical protein
MSNCNGNINIIPNNNEVSFNNINNTITVIDNNCCTQIEVTQPITNIIQISTGPMGAPGTPGASGSSAPFYQVGNSNVWFTTSSIEITGSLTISGSNTFKNIGPAKFLGTLEITGSDYINSIISFVSGANISTSGPNIDMTAGPGGWSEIGSNNGQNYVWVDDEYIRLATNWSTNAYVWYIDMSGNITGSGNINMTGYSVTASLLGTASYALETLSSSYALTASYIENLNIETGSFVLTSSFNNFTASYYQDSSSFNSNINLLISQTSSYIQTSQTSSMVVLSSSYSQNTTSASFANTTISASFTQTASFAQNAATASNILGGKATHIPYFITDTTLATSSIYQSGSSTVIINQDSATTANPEALYVYQPSQTSFNVISGKGNLNNYLQLNIQNTNQGTNASSDVVATADNGNETTNYIDMGINSENYSQNFVGAANDAYLYSTGRYLHIGNTSNFPVQIFAGGSDVDIHNKLELNPNNQHSMSGSLDVSGSIKAFSFTGSLLGTATNAINSSTASYVAASNVVGTVTSASHAIQADNAATANFASIAGNGGVTKIIQGVGITLIPSTGLGDVTIISSGGGGVTIISGSNVTQSFNNTSTWTFDHNLGTRVPIITVFDTNYKQIIPQDIELVNTSSATITFPTAESGFAVASLGGATGTVLSSSYSLFSTYATTASYYAETDPVFVAKSASLATTGSNTFRGNQIVTGSLFTSGSNTLIGNTVLSGSINISGSSTIQGTTTMSGSLNISGSTTQTGNNTLIGTTTLTGSILINGNITPEVSSSFDLGSETNPWRSIYVQSGSISIQSDIPGGIPAVISNANGNVTFAGAGFQLKSGSFVPFEVNSQTRTVIRVPNLPAGDIGGFSIIGSSTGAYQPVTNAGGLLHLTSNDEQSARLTVDAFGSGSFVSYVSRKARGTAASPLPVQAGDVMLRMATAGWTGTGYGISTPGVAAATTFEIVALDNFTTSSIGSRMHFYNAPSGSVTRTLSATIDTTGITIPSSSRLFGTASWAINAQTASFLPVGTYNVTASWAVSASQAVSASFATTASYVLNAVSASYVLNAVSASFVTSAQTASYVLNAVSASFAQTASFVRNATTASYVLNAVSASFTSTASYINPLRQDVIITGSLKISGSLTEIGDTVLTGSLTLSSGSRLNINDGFYVNGSKQFNYGQFSSTQTQSGSANTAYSATFDTTDFAQGVSLVSQSRITVANTGLYNIQFSSQLHTTSNEAVDFSIWFAMTGSNIANSNTDFSIEKINGGGFQVAALNFLTQIASGSYVELKYSKTTTNGQLQAKGTQSTPTRPATPSVILTVTQIA